MISVDQNIGLRSSHAPSAVDDFQVCIHRGTQQIGGTCIELACQGKRILLDLGLPLDAGDSDPVSLVPAVPGLNAPAAYDAYALLIEAHGRRLFYSGDIRAHGRKAALYERLVAKPPRPVHAMLMEGSSLGRLDPGQQFPTERAIEAQLVERFGPDGFVGVCASAQNIDRVVSIYRACKRTGRTLLLDLYAMEILRATGNPNVPAAGWPSLAIYVPEYQRRHIARTERFDIVARYKPNRIYREAISTFVARAVMLFRPPWWPTLT
jgi:ribonuclease J